MQSKAPVLLVLLILTLCPQVPATADDGRANINGETLVAITASSFSTSPLHIGDQNVTASITVRNLRSSDGNASNGDERLYNVTVVCKGVEDSNRQLLLPAASPLVWDVQTVDNDGFGYTLGYLGEMNGSHAFSGFRFDVRGIGARPGSYNLSLTINYIKMDTWNALSGPEWSMPLSEEYDNVRFEVVSNVVVGTPVAYTDQLDTTPLYAGAAFQLIGIPVRTLSGALTSVSATLSVPAASAFQPLISPGTSPDAMVGRLTSTATLYFRIDVPRADPGVYGPANANITLVLRYVRETNWDTRIENVAVGEDGLPLTFTVDYTPLLNATGASPVQITRGTEQLDLSVVLRNEGNADMLRVEVTLAADADFSAADYHYDGYGNRVPGAATCFVESIKKGETATAIFHLAVFPNAPAGVHRLELSYSGFFYNTGKTGSSSGYFPVTDALFQYLRGGLPSIDIEVVTLDAALVLVSSPSPSSALNPGGESQGLDIVLSVRNDEHYDLLDARFTILAGEGTPVINPSDRSAHGLQTVIMPRLAAGQVVYLVFESSLNTTLPPGLHALTLQLNATGEDSGALVASERTFYIRTGPFGPDMQLEAGALGRLEAGMRDVVIPITVRNSGSAALGGVRLRLACGPGTPILDQSAPSATSMLREIGSLGPGASAQVEFVADVDRAAEVRTHLLGVELTGSYFASGEPFAETDNITFRVLGAPPLLVVQNLISDPSEIVPGKGFVLTFSVKNIGGEPARGVWVGLVGLAGATAANASYPGGPTGLSGEVPFSADIAVRYIGDIDPGQQVNASFSMLSDVSAGRGRTYQQPLQVSYQDRDGLPQDQQFAIAVRTRAPTPAAAPARDWMPILLLLGLMIIVVVVAAAILAPRRGDRPRPEQTVNETPAAPPERTAQEMPRAEEPSQVAVAVPLQTPPPPPPGYSAAMAQSQPLPPPPAQTAPAAATAMRVEGGTAPQGRAGPLEGYSIPGAETDQPKYSAPPQKPKAYTGKEVPMRNCPTCGNEVKVRFVKCPYCGSDLPPVG
jgi:hypothetical protein